MKSIQLLPLALSLLLADQVSAKKIFVKAGATGTMTGSSWGTAFNELQLGLNAAAPGDTLFVAKGIYRPLTIAGASADTRDKTFLLKDSVKMFGGFAGTETKLSDRDNLKVLDANASYLSGNLGAADSSDNTHHVVTAINVGDKALMNGFVITAGNADGAGSNTISGKTVARNFGGGFYSDNSKIVLEQLRFEYNYALSGGAGMNNENGSTLSVSNSLFINNQINGTDPNAGGGAGMRNNASNVMVNNVDFTYNRAYHSQGGGAVRNEACAPTFKNLFFRWNHSEDGDGGGAVYNAAGANAIFTDLTIYANTTANQGGGMYNDNSKPLLTNVTFENNFATSATGAMENDGGSDAILNNCNFIKNTSNGEGGAMQNWKSSPVINNCQFVSNASSKSGGAIYNYTNCSPRITGCFFIANHANLNGGAIVNKRGSNAIITNCIFTTNSADNNGGGIYNIANTTGGSEPSSPVLTNVTIVNNLAGNSGGGGFDDGFGTSLLRNSIVQGNMAPDNEDIDAPLASVATALYHTIITDQYYETGVLPPTAITSDVFVDISAEDYHLAIGSIAFNKGDSAYYAVGATPDISSVKVDARNADRIMGSNIDLGAYEVCIDTLSPTIAISVLPATPTVASGSSVTFTAAAPLLGSTPKYTWRKNGITIAGASGNTYVAIAGTDFISGDEISALLNSSLACARIDTTSSNKIKMTVSPVGIAGLAFEQSSLKLFPNPNNGTFTLTTNFSNGQEYTMNILDLTGRSIYTEKFTGAGNTKPLNLGGKIPAGTYMLSIENAEMPKQVKRFVIQ